MRVPDYILKCVGFVGEVIHEDSSGIDADWHGTGFFVSVPPENFLTFVTAKHIALGLQGKKVCFAVNKKDGGITTIQGHLGSWWTHPTDEKTDIAVMPFNLTPDLDILSISVNDFLTSEEMSRRKIGVGDEVFMAGLFTFVPSSYDGAKRNMPIIRHGNIAMLPDEPIQTDAGYSDVYLIEARSIGGLSGSPVFARPTVFMKVKLEDGSDAPIHGIGGFQFLGLVHGHWDINEADMNKPQLVHWQRGVNLGIAIVIPASKIIETLNRKELVEMREEYRQMTIRQKSPTPDSGETVENVG